jgi:hypothetical protein
MHHAGAPAPAGAHCHGDPLLMLSDLHPLFLIAGADVCIEQRFVEMPTLNAEVGKKNMQIVFGSSVR